MYHQVTNLPTLLQHQDNMQFQHAARQRHPSERQPSDQLGESNWGASLKIPGNEAETRDKGIRQFLKIIAKIKITWGLYM